MPKKKVNKVVIDTNIFISAVISPKSPPAAILRAVQGGHVQLLTSDDIVDEYLRACRCHLQCNLATDSTTRSSYQRDFAVKQAHPCLLNIVATFTAASALSIVRT